MSAEEHRLNGTFATNDPTKHAEYNYGNPPPLGNAFMAQMFGFAEAPKQDPPMINYRNRTLGQPFRLRERMKTLRPMYGAGSLLGETESCRIMAQLGFDWIFLDWEHTPFGVRELVQLIKTIQYASEGNTAVVVRVPNFEHHHIAYVLDAGASGIIIPHTETVEEAEAVLRAARFPTHGGARSFPPGALAFGISDGAPDGQGPFDIFAQAAVILQIESDLGCKNADKLAALPGVDGLMVGMGDLRLDMHLPPGNDGTEKAYNENVRRVIAACQKHSKPAWCFTSGAEATVKRAEQGFTGFMMAADSWAMTAALRSGLATGVKAVREWEASGKGVRLYDGNWGEAADERKAAADEAGKGKSGAEETQVNGQTNGAVNGGDGH